MKGKTTLFLMMLIMVGSVFGYTYTEDTTGDDIVDTWNSDLDSNFRFERWNYDLDADSIVDYYQYDYDDNCYPRYTNRRHPTSSTGSATVDHWYADLDENTYYDRKNYDTNGDGLADIYSYDMDGDGIYEALYVDDDFDFLIPGNPETFDQWFNDTDADGDYETCRFDLNGDDNFSYGDDFEVINAAGCYNYSFVVPVTSNDVYNLNSWRCHYGIPNVTLIIPVEGYVSSTNLVSFSCYVEEMNPASIITTNSLYVWDMNGNVVYTDTETINAVNATSNWIITLADGNYEWNCLSVDNFSFSGRAEVNNTLNVNVPALPEEEETDRIREALSVQHLNNIGGELEPVKAGTDATVRLTLYNSGDTDFKDTSIKVSIPDLDVLAPKVWYRDLDNGNSETFTFVLEIPSSAPPGEYMVRLYVRSGDTTRIVHRPIIVD